MVGSTNDKTAAMNGYHLCVFVQGSAEESESVRVRVQSQSESESGRALPQRGRRVLRTRIKSRQKSEHGRISIDRWAVEQRLGAAMPRQSTSTTPISFYPLACYGCS
eukprot:365067-Chlamydomonas_euryale.AAC.12